MAAPTNELPILYSEPMAQAKRKGTKTVTRRIKGEMLKAINENLRYTWQVTQKLVVTKPTKTKPGREQKGYLFQCAGVHNIVLTCPYGEVGDILWGKETVACCDFGQGDVWCYRADQPDNTDIKWTASIHMPKVAARIWDRITATRLERLHDITEADAIAEGLERWKSPLHPGQYEYLDYSCGWQSRFTGIGFVQATTAYMSLWESINGKDSWKINPYVWVIETEAIERPAHLNQV